MMRIHTKALAISTGIVFGVSVGIMTIISVYTGYGREMLVLLSSVYPGYDVSLIGAALGVLYGFIDMAIFMSAIGFLYNKLFVRM